jgi:uncharacterized membrane protein
MAPLVDPREKAEKGLSSLSTPGERFAYWLSQITSPFVVGLGVLGYVSLPTTSRVPDGLRWLTVIGVGLLVPFGCIWWGVKTGKLTAIHVSRRSERLVPLLVGLMALGGMLAGLLLLSASRPLVATLVAVIVSFALATLITHVAKYKISLHIDSAAGAVTVCWRLSSPVFLALSPLVVLIAWARWKLEAHSPLQAICGAALAVTMTVTTFWLFGLR